MYYYDLLVNILVVCYPVTLDASRARRSTEPARAATHPILIVHVWQAPQQPPSSPPQANVQQQPGPTAPMLSNVKPPRRKSRKLSSSPRNPNNVKLLDCKCKLPEARRVWECATPCMGIESCLFSWLCPIIFYRLSCLRGRPIPPHRCFDGCRSDLRCTFRKEICCGTARVLQIGQWAADDNRYSMPGNACKDCFCIFCCTPCRLTHTSS
ncbi:hypothetical protein SCHPADRAFT_174624 [Schizopora paradoxa]|uniref:PLAC8-domain-containing protein n=1 Tax=Schizopora paradoxa TaxID=27342 RepID=A0A0H2S0C6_9AGAM|nr:hypothetical protein SCHPADRAFT_174624 [Schizopora paradoxa]